jgi:large conductance mechanosensitive channel
MLRELREFLLRGNVIDLAVAVVIGAAFAAITTSLVGDIITPLLTIIGLPDLSSWVIPVGDSDIRIGAFLNTLIWFLLVGTSIFFFVVKPMKELQERFDDPDDDQVTVFPGPTQTDLLIQIRDELRRANSPPPS